MPGAGATLREAMGEKDLRKEKGWPEGRLREAPRDPRTGSREKEMLGATAIAAASDVCEPKQLLSVWGKLNPALGPAAKARAVGAALRFVAFVEMVGGM
ncbi:hypothetical protein GW17_00036784 [Ensete ventricosum]|nr:hypothetical protein GW17_00036784 [Ensete ventricosum]